MNQLDYGKIRLQMQNDLNESPVRYAGVLNGDWVWFSLNTGASRRLELDRENRVDHGPGTIALINGASGTAYHGECSSGLLTGPIISVTRDLLPDWFSNVSSIEVRTADDLTSRLARDLARVAAREAPAIRLCSLCCELVEHVSRDYGVPATVGQAEHAAAHEARRQLFRKMANPPSLAQLASSLGVRPGALSFAFRRCFGCAPREYLAEARLLEGRSLLLDTTLPVSQIAYRVGATPEHFSSAFRARFGLSPRNFRKL